MHLFHVGCLRKTLLAGAERKVFSCELVSICHCQEANASSCLLTSLDLRLIAQLLDSFIGSIMTTTLPIVKLRGSLSRESPMAAVVAFPSVCQSRLAALQVNLMQYRAEKWRYCERAKYQHQRLFECIRIFTSLQHFLTNSCDCKE